MNPSSAEKALLPAPFANRFGRWLLGFTVGLALGASPFLGVVNVPGFRTLLTVMPFQIRSELVSLSTFLMPVVAVASQFYSEERLSPSFLRKRFRFALTAMIAGFFLFVFLRSEFTVTVPRGATDVTVLIGASPDEECLELCENPERRPVDCVRSLSLDPVKIERCWGYDALKRRKLILEVCYLLLTSGMASLIGLALLRREIRERENITPGMTPDESLKRQPEDAAAEPKGATDASPTKRFRVAFSFAGEKRDYVAQVASILAARFGEAAVLYDKFHEAELARRDLGFYLPDLYHKQSDLVVVVVCPDYEGKEWCGLEWDAIFDLLKKRRNEEVMLCRFEYASVKGLYSTAGFMELDDKTPEQATARILERLALNEGKPKDYYLSDVPLR